MLAKRIIPCLDVKDGKTVKGVNFVNFRDAGDPVELGAKYSEDGADELVFSTLQHHTKVVKPLSTWLNVAANISIPYSRWRHNELSDVERLLNAGADKVSLIQLHAILNLSTT